MTALLAGTARSGTLTMDTAGKLYGATYQAGTYGQGAVFKLTPTSGGWSYTSLHEFTGGSDRGYPVGNVIFDANGNMYGTASGGRSIRLWSCVGDHALAQLVSYPHFTSNRAFDADANSKRGHIPAPRPPLGGTPPCQVINATPQFFARKVVGYFESSMGSGSRTHM